MTTATAAMERSDVASPEHQAAFRGIHATTTGRWKPGTCYLRCTCGWQMTGIADVTRGGQMREAYGAWDIHKKKPPGAG